MAILSNREVVGSEQRLGTVQLDAFLYHHIERIFGGRSVFHRPFQALLALVLRFGFSLGPQNSLPESALKSGPTERIRTAPHSDCQIPGYTRDLANRTVVGRSVRNPAAPDPAGRKPFPSERSSHRR